MSPRRHQRFSELIAQPISMGIIIFLAISALVFWLNQLVGTTITDFVAEMNGMMMDIVIFAILLMWLYRRQEHARQLRNYREQLEDFKDWNSEEGVLRKVGVIRRIQRMGHPLPSLRDMAFKGAYFSGFDLNHVDFRLADLEAAFFLKCDLEKANLLKANLRRAYFQAATLRDVTLQEAFCPWADFRDANLTGANLACVNIQNAVLWKANLEGADGEGAYAYQADFSQANLDRANFYRAHLNEAIFTQASLREADFRSADLSRVQGLEAEQLAQAHIDDQTIFPKQLQSQKKAMLAAAQARHLPPPQSRFSHTPPHYPEQPNEHRPGLALGLETTELDP